MTREEAKAEQDRIVKAGFELGWWYGTRCKKCCDVYPKCMSDSTLKGYCWYQCPVCGKKSTKQVMPWVAQLAWDAGDYQQEQVRWF